MTVVQTLENKRRCDEVEERFSCCDLLKQSKSHIQFLRALHRHGTTIESPTEDSFRRYSQIWLPLVYQDFMERKQKANDGVVVVVGLIPPPDIAWLWHCHRLAPYRYHDYVQKRFFQRDDIGDGEKESYYKNFLDPPLPFTVQYEEVGENNHIVGDSAKSDQQEENDNASPLYGDEESCKYTRNLWAKLFPNEPFFLQKGATIQENDPLLPISINHTPSRTTLIGNKKDHDEMIDDFLLGGFDILESCKRQAAFLWQVSGSRFSNEDFLKEGVENYYKFLHLTEALKASSPSSNRPQFIVPTYQIDLMWHTHMLTSINQYHADCMRINKRKLEHDDSLTDRTDGSVLDKNFKDTCKLWKVYDQEYRVKGGMYRGEPPKEYFTTNWALLPQNVISTMLPLPVDILTHLIGEIGASSKGNIEDQVLVVPGWMSIDNPDAFLPAAPKSNVKGVNNNPRKKSYIFGMGVKGSGYYHIHTRESYDVVKKRISNQLDGAKRISIFGGVLSFVILFMVFVALVQENAIAGIVLLILAVICCFCIFLWRYMKRIQQLKDLEVIIDKKMASSGPFSELDLPDELRHRVQKNTDNRGGDDTNVILFEASGCGGSDGGGGGGGACGGGACGSGGG